MQTPTVRVLDLLAQPRVAPAARRTAMVSIAMVSIAMVSLAMVTLVSIAMVSKKVQRVLSQ